MVLLAGSELFTGNCLFLMPLLRGNITAGSMLKSWAIVYLGNLFGSVAVAFLVARCGALNGVAEAAVSTALTKAVLPFGAALLRGVLCNFLVCLAVWMSFGARTMADKLLCVIMPITAFVACGFEHSIANMFFLFEGLFAQMAGFGAGGIALSGIFYNIGVVTLANIVGGALMVGVSYWLAYAKREKK